MQQQFPLQQYFQSASRLVFGCMGLGGDWDQSQTTTQQRDAGFNAIDAAFDAGINVFDHADIYTLGKAEQVFGDYLQKHPAKRQQMVLQSKCAIRFKDAHAVGRYDFSAAYLTASVDGILKRLRTDHLDILLLHRPDPLMEVQEVAAVVSDLQQQGKIKHIGVSNFGAPQLQLLQSALKTPIIVNQLEMSLLKHDWLEQNVLTGMAQGAQSFFGYGTLEYCQMTHVQLQAWGSLAQGLYTGGKNNLSAAEFNTAQLVSDLASQYQVSPEAIVLAWLMRHPAAISPVIGTTNVARIQACQQAVQLQLSREHWYALYVSARGRPLP